MTRSLLISYTALLTVILFTGCTSDKDSEKELVKLNYAQPIIKEIKNLKTSKLPTFDSLHYYYDNTDAKIKRLPEDSIIRPIKRLVFPLANDKTHMLSYESISFEFIDSLDFDKLPIANEPKAEKTYPMPFDNLEEIELDKPIIIKANKPKLKEVNDQTILHLSTDQNLPDNNVRNLIQDLKGRLWIETDKGISIYDKENFFFFDKKSALISGSYFKMQSSTPDKIFITAGTSKIGEAHINIINGTKIKRLNLSVDTSHYAYNVFGHEILKRDKRDLAYFVECDAIKPDGNDGIWFTFIFSVNRNEILKEFIIPFYYDYKYIYKYESYSFKKSILDKNKEVWKATSAGVCVKHKNKLKALTTLNKLSNNNIRDIFCDNQNIIWFNNSDNIYKIEKNKLFRLKINDKTFEKLKSDNSLRNLKISSDHFGNILLYSKDKPIGIIDQHQISLIEGKENYFSNSTKLSLIDSKIFAIPENNGFYIFPKDFFQNYKLKSLKDSLRHSTNIVESENNLIYSNNKTAGNLSTSFYSNNGQIIQSFDLKKITTNLKYNDFQISNICNFKNKNIVNGYLINSILEESDSIRLIPYDNNNFVFNGTISLIDNQNRIIMPGGFWINGGLDIIRNDTVFNIPHEFYFKISPIGSVTEDNNSNIWFGSDHGIVVLSNKNIFYQLKKELSDTTITSIHCDQRGMIWVGTEDGLNIFQPNSKNGIEGRILVFKKENGIPSNHIININSDSHGNVWITTTNGISKFVCTVSSKNAHTYEITNYSINDGLLSNNLSYLNYDNNGYCMLIKKKGFRDISYAENTLILLTNSGIQLFNPGLNDTSSLKCFLSHIDINNTEFSSYNITNTRIKWQSVNEDLIYKTPNKLTLSHGDNNILFHFTSNKLDEINSIKYSYIMEGYDDNWNNLSEESNAEYKQLPYGEYTFKVIAKSKNGQISRPIQFSFEILPPWYKTWWAYSTYLFFGLVVVIGIIKIRTRKLEKEKEKLEETIKERTIEVVNQKEIAEQQKHLVEEKQKEILDSIKYAKRIQSAHMPTEKYIGKNIDRLKDKS